MKQDWNPLGSLCPCCPGGPQTYTFLFLNGRKLNHLFPFLYSGHFPSVQGWSGDPTMGKLRAGWVRLSFASEWDHDGWNDPLSADLRARKGGWRWEKDVHSPLRRKYEDSLSNRGLYSNYSLQPWNVHFQIKNRKTVLLVGRPIIRKRGFIW